jgi:hypothetical protein
MLNEVSVWLDMRIISRHIQKLACSLCTSGYGSTYTYTRTDGGFGEVWHGTVVRSVAEEEKNGKTKMTPGITVYHHGAVFVSIFFWSTHSCYYYG